MRIAIFAHSFIADWNHGNAHFLRGIAVELQSRGDEVSLYEPRESWSLGNLIRDYGEGVVESFRQHYPSLSSKRYDLHSLDLHKELEGTDLIIVHEWNDPQLVRKIGEYRSKTASCRALFHDTHHRSVTDPEAMSAFDLSNYDGVLAFGEIIRQIYLRRCWARRVWTWHEAADTRIFSPRQNTQKQGDLVWIGNWGDEERSEELWEFLVGPVKVLRLRCRVHGVRYHEQALKMLQNGGIEYAGWVPNYRVPEVLSQFRVTVHIPRRPYVEALPGIPTIRIFEALSCGIPLVCSPWSDCEKLFREGEDYLIAKSGRQMKDVLNDLLRDDEFALEMAQSGFKAVLERHTCSHRVDELIMICTELGLKTSDIGHRQVR